MFNVWWLSIDDNRDDDDKGKDEDDEDVEE